VNGNQAADVQSEMVAGELILERVLHGIVSAVA